MCEKNIKNPVNTGHYLDVNSTSFERHERQMDVKKNIVCFILGIVKKKLVYKNLKNHIYFLILIK